MAPLNTRVLVVDDNSSDRIVVCRLFEKFGISDVQVAEDGSIGESKVLNAEHAGKPFQLIMVDWNMPGMNGLKLIKEIRRSKFTKAAKIIVMTADSEVEVVEAALAHGANDFIVKPVSAKILKDKLEKLFAGR